jgi:hypothetical protein
MKRFELVDLLLSDCRMVKYDTSKNGTDVLHVESDDDSGSEGDQDQDETHDYTFDKSWYCKMKGMRLS